MQDNENDRNITNNQGREILGTGGVINTHHQGESKRPTERGVEAREDREKKWVKKTFKGKRLDSNGKIEVYTYDKWVWVKE